MNTAHWHLLLNHLPIVGIIGGTAILFAGFILKNNSTVKRTALGVVIFSTLLAIPVYLTGEGAEEIVEDVAGVTANSIEEHEDLAKIFLIVVSCLGILAIITSVMDWMKYRLTSVFYALVLIVGIGTSIFVKSVSTSGGEIRHTEIQNTAQQQGNGTQKSNTEENEND